MKKIVSISISIMLAFIVSMYAFSKDAHSQKADITQSTETIGDSKLIVYYFHTTARCVSCHKIEQYTKEAVEKYFFDEIARGRLDFKMLNVEEPPNKHFVQDYQLYTKSVVISKIIDGKEAAFKNLDKVWQFLRNKEKFYSYIKDETEKLLN